MLEKAVNELDNLNTGERFSLSDLYKGYEWSRLKQGEKSTLGTLFLNFAKTSEKIEIHESYAGQKKYSLKYK